MITRIVCLALVCGLVGWAQPARKGSGRRTASGGTQQDVKKLRSDVAGIKQGSQVTQSQKDALKADLNAMAKGATKPDPAVVDKLAADLSSAMADGTVSNKEKAKLMKDVEVVMNSAGVSTSELTKAISDAQAILVASGVSKADVQLIVNDLKAIANRPL